MAEHSDPWKCGECRKIAKASSNFCAFCGKHWSLVWDRSFVHQPGNWSYTARDGVPRSPRASRDQWPEQPARQRSSSQRSRRKRSGKPSKGKGEEKGKSKSDGGKANGGGKQSGTVPPALAPSLAKEEAWKPPSAPPAPSIPQPPSQQAESAQLKGLLSALKKVSADLPPEVQSAMQKMQMDDSKQLTKQLHSAVSQLGNSKKTLVDLTTARANLHQSWSAFLEAAITRWQRYSEEFTQQDTELSAQIEKAKENMRLCKDHFKSLQALEGQAAQEEAEVISDEELSAQPSKVDVHMKQMQESLQQLKGGMEEELRTAKRQRTEAIKDANTEQKPGGDGTNASHCGQGGK